MKIEMLALLDLVQSLIKNDKAEKLNEEPIKDHLLQHADSKLINQLIVELESENYNQALDLIQSYRVLCRELLSVYKAIVKDYRDLQAKNIKENIEDVLNEKYGISKVEHVVELLSIKMDEAPHSVLMEKY